MGWLIPLFVVIGQMSAWSAEAWTPASVAVLEQALADGDAAWTERGPLGVDPLEDLYGPAFDLAKDARDPVATALVRWRIGQACRAHGMAQHALYELEQGLAGLRRRVVGRKATGATEGRAVLNVGAKGFQAGQAVALDLYWVPTAPAGTWLLRDEGAERVEAALLVGVANLYQSQQQVDQAEGLYAEAAALADRLGDDTLRVGVRTNQAWLALRQGRNQVAIEHLKALQAEGLLDDDAQNVQMRQAWLARGAALVQAGRARRAIGMLSEALDLYRRAGDDVGRALVLVHRGRALEALGQPDKALGDYRQAIGLGPVGGDVTWAAPLGVARILAGRDDGVGALNAYAAYLDALEARAAEFGTDEGRFSLVEAHATHLDAMVRLAVDRARATGDAELAYRVTERARRRSLPALMARTAHEHLPVGELPADRLDPRPDDRAPMVAQMALSVDLTRDFGTDLVLADLGTIRGDGPFALPPQPSGVTILAYYVLPEQTVITVREPGGQVHLAVSPIGEPDLAQRARQLRVALGATADPVAAGRGLDVDLGDVVRSAPDLQATLFTELVAPVAAHLPREGPILVVPDGPLWGVPFAALREPDGRWFGERVLTIGVSAGSVAASSARPRPTHASALIVGNPGAAQVDACAAEMSFAGLAGAEAEARGVAALPGWTRVDLLLGNQGDGLRLDAWHGAYGVIHFATHGVVCPDAPLDSFVLVGTAPEGAWVRSASGAVMRRDDPRLPIHSSVRTSASASASASRGPELLLRPEGPLPPDWSPMDPRGILTARHVVDEWQLDADLVALSACETGLGQITSEGTIGLTRAFQAAGARSLLVSLWAVDDQATRALMEAFYAGYLVHGNKAVALRDAMAAVRAHHPDPRLWSSFMLIGPAE